MKRQILILFISLILNSILIYAQPIDLGGGLSGGDDRSEDDTINKVEIKNYLANRYSICNGECAIIILSFMDTVSSNDIVWYRNQDSIPFDTILVSNTDKIRYFVCPKETTSYFFTFQSDTALKDTSSTLTITVYNYPLGNGTINYTVCEDSCLQIGGIIHDDSYVFGWSPPDYLSDASIGNPSVCIDEDIQYILSIGDKSENCFIYDTINIETLSCITSDTESNQNTYLTDDELPYFDLYPNPVKDFLIVKTNNNQEYNMNIYTLHGATVYSDKINSLYTTVQINNLAEGNYLVKIFNKEQVQQISQLITVIN